MNLALLFPGQGMLDPGVLPWLDDGSETPSLQLLRQTLGTGWRERLADTAWRTRNAVAQCLVTGLALAAWERLQPLLTADTPPVAMAGYSVGEVAAFSAAGVFNAAVAMQIVQQRAAIMDRCLQGIDTGLLSIGGATPKLVERLCTDHALTVAIRIGADQVLLGGRRIALQPALAAAEATGAHGQILPIALASHTPWLAAGVPVLEQWLQTVPFDSPHTLLVCNRDAATPRHPSSLRAALASQIAHTVTWDRCMEALAERRVRCVLEVGPGNALARLWSARHPQIPARSVDEFRHPQGAADWVARCLRSGA